jgi:hypothetical protein
MPNQENLPMKEKKTIYRIDPAITVLATVPGLAQHKDEE